MALRPHRDLSLKQLTKLSHDRWNEPARLAEVLDELRARDEGEAQPLIRSIARRLSVLNYRPPEKSDGSSADAGKARSGSAEAAAAQRRRRRALAIILPVAAAAGVAVYLMRDKPPAVPSDKAEAGLDLAGHGAARATPELAARSAAFEFRLDLIDPAVASARPDGRPSLRRSSIPARSPDPLHGPTKPPPAMAEPVDLHLRPSELVVASASVLPLAESEPRGVTEQVLPLNGRRIAEDGIYIGQARLHCYRSERDPEECGPDLWGPRTRPGPLPRPPAIAAATRLTGEPGRAAVGLIGQPPRPQEGRLKPAAPGRPLPPSLGSPRESKDDRAARDRPPAPNCPPPPIGRTVFILDMSLSMGLPLSVDAELEDRLDDGVARKDPEARRRYRELLAQPGPKRITRAREAFEAAAAKLPDWVEMGLVVFRECKDIRKVGIYEAAARGEAVEYIRGLIPRGRTPIAQSLLDAASMLGDGPSSIILLTDGREFCSGDPCAAAAQIKSEHPETPVHVIDIAGQAKGECVAQATGGRVYAPAAAEDLGRVVYNAFRGADASCAAEPATGEVSRR